MNIIDAPFGVTAVTVYRCSWCDSPLQPHERFRRRCLPCSIELGIAE